MWSVLVVRAIALVPAARLMLATIASIIVFVLVIFCFPVTGNTYDRNNFI
jgi:hypothetical protein